MRFWTVQAIIAITASTGFVAFGVPACQSTVATGNGGCTAYATGTATETGTAQGACPDTETHTDTETSIDTDACPDPCLSLIPCLTDADCAGYGSPVCWRSPGGNCDFQLCACNDNPTPCSTDADCAKLGLSCCGGSCQCPGDWPDAGVMDAALDAPTD